MCHFLALSCLSTFHPIAWGSLTCPSIFELEKTANFVRSFFPWSPRDPTILTGKSLQENRCQYLFRFFFSNRQQQISHKQHPPGYEAKLNPPPDIMQLRQPWSSDRNSYVTPISRMTHGNAHFSFALEGWAHRPRTDRVPSDGAPTLDGRQKPHNVATQVQSRSGTLSRSKMELRWGEDGQ